MQKNPINTNADIIHEIEKILPKSKIYLFGSRATGMQTQDSDIDLCVVAPEINARRIDIIFSIQNAIQDKVKQSIDVLVYTNDEFVQRAKLKSTLQHTIMNEGVLLNG